MTAVVLDLAVRDLVDADLAACGFAGSELHLTQVAKELDRARRGEVDYLAVCVKTDLPLAIGGIDYVPHPGAGSLWQLSVHPRLQSCGIGTVLIGAAEQRILARGLDRAEIGVEFAILEPGRYTSGWAMSHTTRDSKLGTSKTLTARSRGTRRCAPRCARS